MCKKVIDFLLFNITTPRHILGIVFTSFFDGILPSVCFIFSISLCSFHFLQILFHLSYRRIYNLSVPFHKIMCRYPFSIAFYIRYSIFHLSGPFFWIIGIGIILNPFFLISFVSSLVKITVTEISRESKISFVGVSV